MRYQGMLLQAKAANRNLNSDNKQKAGERGMRAGVIGFVIALIAIASSPASAQVRDATYRGTMVCDKLPFSAGKSREAIEVTIAGGAVRYTHVGCDCAPTHSRSAKRGPGP